MMTTNTRKVKLLTSFILAVFSLLPTFAQQRLMPGYVVDNKGDTLRGVIDYRNWDKNPLKIDYRQKETDAPGEFYPGSIRAFNVAGETYIAAVVNIDKSSNRPGSMTSTSELFFVPEPAFLQVVIRSPATPKMLLHYRDMNGKDHFFVMGASGPELLVFKNYYKEVGGKKVIASNRKFLGQLSLYMQDCATIQQDLKSVSYSKKSLTKLFSAYYSCTNAAVVSEKVVDRIKLETGILAGVTIANVSFTNSGAYEYLAQASFPQSTKPTGGLFLNLVLPRANGKWSLYNELTLTSFDTEGDAEFIATAPYVHTREHSEFQYSYFNILNMLRYRYPVGKTSLFFNAGIWNGIKVSEKNYHMKQYYNVTGDLTDTNEDKAIKSTRAREIGFVFGAGLGYNRYSFETRYGISNGMSGILSVGSKVTRLTFLVSYRLSK